MDNEFLDITLNNDSTVENWTSDILVPQYSTNTVIRVAYRNTDPNVYMYIVFESNNVRKIMKPDTRRKMAGVVGKTYSFQLTQYETQYYVGEKQFSIVIQNMSGTDIAIKEFSFKMKKMPYNVFENLDLNKDSGLLGVAKGVEDNARDIADLTKLVGSLTIGDVQSDWEETDTESRSYIKNKPTKLSQFENDTGFITGSGTIDDYYTKNEVDEKVSEINASISNLETSTQTKLDTKANISDIANLVDNSTLNNYYTKKEVNNAISTIPKFSIKVVSALPTENISTTSIYLVRKETPGSKDYYDEYIYIGGSWEHLGSISTNLSNYYTKKEVDDLIKALDGSSFEGYYNKEEINEFLATKVSTATLTSEYYTKGAVDSALKDKANTKDVYTIAQTNGKLEDLKQYVNNQDDAYIGRENQVDFNATQSGSTITGTLDETLKDFVFTNNSEYLFHIYLPLARLSGTLDNSQTIKLLDKNANEIHILCMLQKDITKTSTVGDLCQIQAFDPDIGYSWEFRGSYREINENGVIYRTVYTDAIVKESAVAMRGADMYDAMSKNQLANGTVVICTDDYLPANNENVKLYKGHSYKIFIERSTSGVISTRYEELTGKYDDTELKNLINSRVEAEKTAREAAIKGAIDTEVTNRNNAITAAINGLVNSAPGALDTLKELSDALGNDPNFAATITGKIGEVNTKVSTLETSVNTSISSLEESINAEGVERSRQDGALDDRITQEVSAREAAITTLTNALNAEASNREAGDTTLTNNLSAEINARQALEAKAYTTDNLIYSQTAPENPTPGTLWIYDATDSGGGNASIDDTNISTTTTYSSSKIDSTYLKAPEGSLNIENGRITLTNNLNSVYSITNNEVVMELNGDGLRYHDNATNLDVNITPYYGAIDQTVDPATIKVNGIGLAKETDLNKKLDKTGGTVNGNLIVADNNLSLKQGSNQVNLAVDTNGNLSISNSSGSGIAATQAWVEDKLATAGPSGSNITFVDWGE